MIATLDLWSHGLAALLYAMLAAWQVKSWRRDPLGRPLTVAFAVIAAWALFEAISGPRDIKAALTESARNLAFLTFMYGTIRGASEDKGQRAVKLVYAAVAAVVGLQIVLGLLSARYAPGSNTGMLLASTGYGLGMTVAAGSLVLVHNLYGQASPNSRAALQLPVIALAAMWAYDLHLYTYSYLTHDRFNALFALRGAIAAMLVPLFVLARRSGADWRVQLSRSATFQSLSLIAILGYFVLMMSATRLMDSYGGSWGPSTQIGLVGAMTLIALAMLPSARLRAWVRVMVSKHFFEHRYDYRADWLRFTRAIGRSGTDGAPLGERVVKALADIAGSPGGLLLMADEPGQLTIAAQWNWRHDSAPHGPCPAPWRRFLEQSGFIIEFDRIGDDSAPPGAAPMPRWLVKAGAGWAGIPLIHDDRLVGLVILDHPVPRRPMDWEDFDLFRTAGIQAASYLAEARTQDALADAQRFDEFNRRFAFIMHDIKNLVSQLSLVARNAERHADNPEFRADMVATLQSSVQKMNDLLARLSRSGSAEAQPPRAVDLAPILTAIAEGKKRLHPIEIDAPSTLVLADPAGLEQAIGHLVQNAIDASPADAPVKISARTKGGEAIVTVADTGTGMSAEFVRTRLFQPLASTKDNGFGVGAFEARALVAAMGGRLDVASKPGEGTTFTLFLPRAEAQAAAAPDQRMRA